MRVVVTGSRTYTDKAFLEWQLRVRHEKEDGTFDLTVAHGKCPKGADKLAAEVCAELGIDVVEYPADWNRHGRFAGPLRNAQMIHDFKPDTVLAFWDGKSKGTLNCIQNAVQAGVTTVIYPEHPL